MRSIAGLGLSSINEGLFTQSVQDKEGGNLRYGVDLALCARYFFVCMTTLRSRAYADRPDLDKLPDVKDGEREITPVSDNDVGPEDREALEAALARSAAQIDRGELIDAGVVLGRLGPRCP